MVRAFFGLMAAVLVGLLLGASAPLEVLTARVIGVTDGDTITLLDRSKRTISVRLAEIDAPESGQPWGKKSKVLLSDMVFGREVRAEISGTDRYVACPFEVIRFQC